MSNEKDNFIYSPTKGEFVYKNILWNNYTRLEILKEVETFNYRDSDILVCTYARSGTTLTQEIVWQIKNKNIIKKGEIYGDIEIRFPFLEFYDEKPNANQQIHALQSISNDQQRFIKTHCPLNFIQPQLKMTKPTIIVVMRNPKDACTSHYHFQRGISLFGPWKGTWPEFVEMFLRGKIFDGSWLDWNLEWWEKAGRRMKESIITEDGWKVLILTYEDILKWPNQMIRLIADHLEETLSDNELDTIMFNCRFETMANNSETNICDQQTGFKFLRKGQIGNWKEHFSEEESDRMNRAFVEPCAERGLHFCFE